MIFSLLLTACAQTPAPSTTASAPPAEPVLAANYLWLNPTADVERLASRFEAPDGFSRLPVAPDSYAAWLRGLPVRKDREQVHAWDGRPLTSPSRAIIHMDVGNKDLQQCADTTIRLHAEYLWSQGRADEAGYHFTSGDLSRWEDWRKGEHFVIAGSQVKRVPGPARANDHDQYRSWLQYVFRYAGTKSLHFDADPITDDQPLLAGDVFVAPGSPGHAVVLLDVASNANGERVALVGQGFMPAQDLHVVAETGEHTIDGVWFRLPDTGESLDTPSWSPIPRGSAIRYR